MDQTPSREAFNSLLRYIYYGDTKMPPEDSLYLFQAPSFYAFTNNRLQAFCKHNLEHNITYDNVLQILEASDRMNVPDIKNYALRMIVNDYAQVVRLPKMKMLSRELLLDVIMAVADILSEKRISQDLASISIHSDIWKLAFLHSVKILIAWLRSNDDDLHLNWYKCCLSSSCYSML